MRDLWQNLVAENPMLIEMTRFRRRYFSFSAANPMNGVVLSLVLIGYAAMVLIVAENRDAVSPLTLVIIQTGLLTLFAPMTLYGAVAGERERRSWDLLLVAPITKSQIVAGKFIGALSALGIAIGLFLVPIVITGVSYRQAHWQTILVGEAVSVSFLMCVCALTILFSSRVKRGLMALGATLGLLMCGLIVLPALIGSGGSDVHLNDFTFYLHPFYVLGRLSMVDAYYSAGSTFTYNTYLNGSYGGRWWGVAQTFVYVGMTAVLIGWAINTLNFAENEVKFLPQGHKDA